MVLTPPFPVMKGPTLRKPLVISNSSSARTGIAISNRIIKNILFIKTPNNEKKICFKNSNLEK
jgi:hypothetical protein